MVDDHSWDVARLRVARERGQRRIHTGGNFVSPAFDLIDVAKELGKLDELRCAVQACSVRGEVKKIMGKISGTFYLFTKVQCPFL